MIGQFLDRLDDDARDRIIVADAWTIRAVHARDGGRCVIGHAAGCTFIDDRMTVARGGSAVLTLARNFRLLKTNNRFDCLVMRFGMSRVVRAIKLRAGKWTRPHIPEQLVVSPESSVAKP